MNQKPGILNFVGITAIVIASILVLTNVLQLVGDLVMFLRVISPATFDVIEFPSDGLNATMVAIDTVANMIDLVVSIGWIVAGYGAITAASWTRTTANSFTALAIVTEPILHILHTYFSHDYNSALMASYGFPGIEAGENSISSAVFATLCSLPFLMMFPIFFLIQFNMKPFNAALNSANNFYDPYNGGQPTYHPYYQQPNPYGSPDQEPGGWYDQNAPVEPPSHDRPNDQ